MMQLHLDEISRNVAPGAHAVLLLDRAGWHTTSKLDVPDNITPIFLPSRAPELNPVENVWQYLRQNWLSNTVFENYDAIVDAACAAWRKLIAQPEIITSIRMRDWVHVGQPLGPLVLKLLALAAARRSPNKVGAHRIIPNDAQQRASKSGYPPSLLSLVEPRSNVNIGDGSDTAPQQKNN